MTLQLLWTDQCFLAVILISGVILVRGLRKEHVRRSFAQIFKQPIAVSAGVILLLYLLIGVMDSIHFKANDDEQQASLLDYVLAPLGSQYEKTYSAPLATTLYSTETVFQNGKAEQIYPRLNYIPKDRRRRFSTHHQSNRTVRLTRVGLNASTFSGISFV